MVFVTFRYMELPIHGCQGSGLNRFKCFIICALDKDVKHLLICFSNASPQGCPAFPPEWVNIISSEKQVCFHFTDFIPQTKKPLNIVNPFHLLLETPESNPPIFPHRVFFPLLFFLLALSYSDFLFNSFPHAGNSSFHLFDYFIWGTYYQAGTQELT